eukprot:CAMPEP_0178372322 /NCGR_PEP_ID=MMETSP0689_2-20121128/1291_1 /TAXON_ID=160604 /ORGANISM="Amphidinium massartii, Strain CS-259" /LENGTH=623 /DNA_ID=CAMNT_0019992237 /DNA_START=174 /DNA_END=2045 /DNA_ORIENTATION=+
MISSWLQILRAEPRTFKAIFGAILFWLIRASSAYSSAQAYTYTDPALYDAGLQVEEFREEQRDVRSCECKESRHSDFWKQLLDQLHDGLASDPSFSGDWVHDLCGRVYPLIFRTVNINPDDGGFTMHTDCPAAVLSMVVTCVQSAALQNAEKGVDPMLQWREGARPEAPSEESPGEWRQTMRVVSEEGEAVADFFASMQVEECISHCQRHPSCRSFAHGPHGCHLKSRCISPDDPLVPQGSQGDDYQTHYILGGPCANVDGSTDASAPTRKYLEEVESMMQLAIRILDFAFLCLDASSWPFTSGEVFENYARSVEAPGEFVWNRAVSFRLLPAALEFQAKQTEDWKVSAYLTRLRVRWSRGLESEASFWRKKLSQSEEINNSLERLKTWLANGSVSWSLPGDEICSYALANRTAKAPPPRIANVGSGPFAPGPLDCADGPSRDVLRIPVVAADGLARYYQRVFDEHSFQPLYWPHQCPVEELDTCFPASHFDVVHCRNALDHSFDPLLGMIKMLHVVRPGGWVLLRHARNEGVPGQFRNGLHQWAFDSYVRDGGDVGFLIWNPGLRCNVTDYLLEKGFAAEVRTTVKDHPSEDAPEDEKFIWVEIRKPTRSEVSLRLARGGAI